MMINTQYSSIVEQARKSGASYVDFKNTKYKVPAIASNQDTFTLSSAAKAKMTGNKFVEEVAPTYIKPESARELLARANKDDINDSVNNQTESGLRFEEVMQSILDQRLGVDREKLKEIEAMMEEIANNENLSPEEKRKAMEELEKMREEIIKDSLDIRKQAQQSFEQKEDI